MARPYIFSEAELADIIISMQFEEIGLDWKTIREANTVILDGQKHILIEGEPFYNYYTMNYNQWVDWYNKASDFIAKNVRHSTNRKIRKWLNEFDFMWGLRIINN